MATRTIQMGTAPEEAPPSGLGAAMAASADLAAVAVLVVLVVLVVTVLLLAATATMRIVAVAAAMAVAVEAMGCQVLLEQGKPTGALPGQLLRSGDMVR